MSEMVTISKERLLELERKEKLLKEIADEEELSEKELRQIKKAEETSLLSEKEAFGSE
ncbi:MAG: hypothetical protein ABH828_02475 [archaeon]